MNGARSSAGHRLRQQRPPHVDARHAVLIFRRRQQVLALRDFDDAGQAGVVAGARLRFALPRRRHLHRRVLQRSPAPPRARRRGVLLGW